MSTKTDRSCASFILAARRLRFRGRKEADCLKSLAICRLRQSFNEAGTRPEFVINGKASADAWEKAWTAPTPRPQRGQPHVYGPLGGAFLIPRPMAVVDYWPVTLDDGTGGTNTLAFRPRRFSSVRSRAR